MKDAAAVPLAFTGYQKFVVGVLAFLQFTIILDFMILSPLGAILMPELKISTAQFGLVVSVYAFSAGASGILAAGFADRFDRKKLLMFFYAGFVLGTLFCGVAWSYQVLLLARMITGIFGGVIGSICFAITTDLFPLQQRGRVMGFVQTSFAASQILGLPLGLYFSNLWGWHAPFLLIVAISVLVGILILFFMQPIDTHLALKHQSSPLKHIFSTVSNRTYLQAFATTALLSTGGFMMMPFGSAFSVNNLGIDLDHLPLVYMVTGVVSIIVGPLVGRWSDIIGKFRMFAIGTGIGALAVLIYTHLGVTPIGWVILISSIMFASISSRMVSSSALISAIPSPTHRGSFMSISSSLQQISGGVAAALAGMIVVQPDQGPLQNFDVLGYVVIGAMMITVVMMYFIDKKVMAKTI